MIKIHTSKLKIRHIKNPFFVAVHRHRRDLRRHRRRQGRTTRQARLDGQAEALLPLDRSAAAGSRQPRVPGTGTGNEAVLVC